ncbi:MAG: hypothetical protein AAGD13_08655 [Pseudomonadota bacterium]
MICIALIAPAVLALARQAPKPGEPVIVIAPPWGTALQISAVANGRFVAPGRIEAIALVSSDNHEFTDSLYAAGAWLVLNGDLSNILCQTK